MDKQTILNAFQRRHACKEFDSSRKISTEDFDFILETARLSPSSFGFEPWHFLIVQKSRLREAMLPIFWGGQGQIPTASHIVLALAKKGYFMRYDSEYIQRFLREVQQLPEDIVELKSGFYKKFQETDFDLLSSDRAMTDWATHQTYIPLANMMTSAALIGIDSCPMEGFDRAKADVLIGAECDIDMNKYTVAYGVAFGYRKSEPRGKTRQDMNAVTTWIE